LTFMLEFSILSEYKTLISLWKHGRQYMPIYEYKCQSCGKKSSLLIRTHKEKTRPVCPHCHGKELRRVYSRFAMGRSDEDRMERLADPSQWGGIDENDPKSVMKWAKRMGKEMGEETGEDFDQMIEEEFEKETKTPDDSSDEA